MIETPTVLILGAGASMPYGYPSGKELLVRVVSDLCDSNSSKLRDALVSAECVPGEIDTFGHALKHSGDKSIDAFLETRSEFMEIGRLAMAWVLIQKEQPQVLFDVSNEGENDRWYQLLWEQMNSDFESLRENKLAIITFNYDRSLEEYLGTSLKYKYGKSEKECVEMLRQIPIIHVHGILGGSFWTNEPYWRVYGPEVKDLRRTAEGIKIVHDSTLDSSPEFARAHEELAKAERIYFLGFGYNKKNVSRLKLDSLKQPFVLKGTSYGLKNMEKESAIGRIRKGMTGNARSSVGLALSPGWDIIDFFGEVAELG